MNKPTILLRNGKLPEPRGPFRALENVEIEQLGLLQGIHKAERLLAEHYIDHKEQACEDLIREIQAKYTMLHRLLQRSRALREEIRGIIACKGNTPKSQGFDYSGYGIFPD